MGNRQSSKTRWLFTFLALFGLALATACAGSGNNNSPAASSSSSSSGPAATAQLAPPDQQVLHLRLQGEPKTIDPQLSSIINEASLMKPLFAGLFTYDKDLNVVTSVAKQVPTVENGGISADGKTYTIQLAEDAKWSDGQPLTASDFVYSMQRELDPATAGPYASFYYGIVGAQDYNKAMGTKAAPKTPSDADLATLRSAVGVSAQGDHTLVYHLTQPNPSFLDLLASWSAYPVRQDVIAKYGDTWTEPGNIVSDGPFVLNEWDHNSKIVFTPNTNWFGVAPKLTRIEVNFISDDAAAYAAYLSNQLDSVTVPASAIKEVTTPGSDLNKQLTITPDLRTYALFMNNNQAPFDNELVRQAFGTAIDRQAYVDGVLQGAGVPTTSWIPPGMPGYNKDLGAQYSFNAQKAKDLLAQAGFADGKGLPKITFIMVASDSNKIVGQFIQDQLKKNLGVDVDFQYLDSKAYGGSFGGGDYQATIQSWSADWPYPDNWLPDQFGTGAGNNLVNFSNPQFDDLMAKAAAELDNQKRLDLYDQGQKLMLDYAPIVPLYNRVSYTLTKPNVKNLVITGIDGAIKGDYNLWQTYIAAPGSN